MGEDWPCQNILFDTNKSCACCRNMQSSNEEKPRSPVITVLSNEDHLLLFHSGKVLGIQIQFFGPQNVIGGLSTQKVSRFLCQNDWAVRSNCKIEDQRWATKMSAEFKNPRSSSRSRIEGHSQSKKIRPTRVLTIYIFKSLELQQFNNFGATFMLKSTVRMYVHYVRCCMNIPFEWFRTHLGFCKLRSFCCSFWLYFTACNFVNFWRPWKNWVWKNQHGLANSKGSNSSCDRNSHLHWTFWRTSENLRWC